MTATTKPAHLAGWGERAVMRALLSFAAGSLVGAPASAQSGPPRPAEIHTSASVEVTLPPDHASVSIGIEGRGSTAAAAGADHGRRIQHVQAALASLGFGPGNYQSLGFAVTPNYDYTGGRRLVDYTARTTIQLKLTELNRVAQVLDTALAAGATDIPVLIFESDTAAGGRRAALTRAVAEAQADARALAQAGGGRLGRLLSLTTLPQFDLASQAMLRSTSPTAGMGPIIQREVRIRVVVQGRWEFILRP